MEIMEEFIEKLDAITEFRTALKAFAAAKGREVRLKVEYDAALAREYIASKASTHNNGRMKAMAKTEKEAKALAMAKVEALVLRHLVEHLKAGGGSEETFSLFEDEKSPIR